MRIPDDGGEPEQLTMIPTGQDDTFRLHPHILPDGDSILFVESSDSAADRIAVFSETTGEVTYLLQGEGYRYPRYAPSGHLVFRVGNMLHAARFDIDRLTVTSPVVPVVEDLSRAERDQTGSLGFSDTGSLVHLSSSSTVWTRPGASRPTAPTSCRSS